MSTPHRRAKNLPNKRVFQSPNQELTNPLSKQERSLTTPIHTTLEGRLSRMDYLVERLLTHPEPKIGWQGSGKRTRESQSTYCHPYLRRKLPLLSPEFPSGLYPMPSLLPHLLQVAVLEQNDLSLLVDNCILWRRDLTIQTIPSIFKRLMFWLERTALLLKELDCFVVDVSGKRIKRPYSIIDWMEQCCRCWGCGRSTSWSALDASYTSQFTFCRREEVEGQKILILLF